MFYFDRFLDTNFSYFVLQENVLEYSGQKLSNVEPHIFAISEATFQQLNDNNNNGIDGKTNQSCIISGESGAGKVIQS